MPSAPDGGRRTIYAPASGSGRAAVCVIRISGPDTAAVLTRLLRGSLPEARRASLRRLYDPQSGDLLDRALVLWLPGPASFTGEDQAELHIHGSRAVRDAVLRALSGIAGCRPAEPGEFTRRAFLEGKLDLTAVEGLADLIDAETELQRRQALRQSEGALARSVAAWQERLVEALAACEAALDFSDEGDVPADIGSQSTEVAISVHREIAGLLADSERGERVRDGFQVAIVGPPNAGKSTLLNAIARRDVAIVSSVPGTTRDVIEVRCDLRGLPVVFADTAGLRDSDDPVEREGIARARRRMRDADLVLLLDAADTSEAALTTGRVEVANDRLLRVATKSDLDLPARGSDVRISAETGAGLQELLDRIEGAAEAAMVGGSEALLTRERHRVVLTCVCECLDRVASGRDGAEELVAEDIRLALRELGRMTGDVDVEEVLDRIFSSFCIGK